MEKSYYFWIFHSTAAASQLVRFKHQAVRDFHTNQYQPENYVSFTSIGGWEMERKNQLFIIPPCKMWHQISCHSELLYNPPSLYFLLSDANGREMERNFSFYSSTGAITYSVKISCSYGLLCDAKSTLAFFRCFNIWGGKEKFVPSYPTENP